MKWMGGVVVTLTDATLYLLPLGQRAAVAAVFRHQFVHSKLLFASLSVPSRGYLFVGMPVSLWSWHFFKKKEKRNEAKRKEGGYIRLCSC